MTFHVDSVFCWNGHVAELIRQIKLPQIFAQSFTEATPFNCYFFFGHFDAQQLCLQFDTKQNRQNAASTWHLFNTVVITKCVCLRFVTFHSWFCCNKGSTYQTPYWNFFRKNNNWTTEININFIQFKYSEFDLLITFDETNNWHELGIHPNVCWFGFEFESIAGKRTKLLNSFISTYLHFII